MADRLLLESGAPDGYLLEDGSGVLLLEVPVCFFDAVIADAPEGYWRFGEGSGSLIDAIGSNDGTAGAGVTYGTAGALSGDSDTALSFDGSATAVVTMTQITLPAAGSIEVWGYVTTMVDTAFFGQWKSNQGVMLQPTIGPDEMHFAVNGTFLVAAMPSLSAWHYYLGTWDGSFARLYIDGVLAAGPTAVGSPTTPTTPLTVGKYADTPGSDELIGRVDEPAWYNVALSAVQAATHYAARSVSCTSAVDVSAGHASGSGAANQANKSVAPHAGHAAATGAANQPNKLVRPAAGHAAATGAAYNPSVRVSSNAGHAAATGVAQNSSSSVAVRAGHAHARASVVVVGSWASKLAALSPYLWWKLDDGPGAVALDASGNSRDGVVVGTLGVPSLLPDVSGSAWIGTPGQTINHSAIAVGDAFSIGAWVHPSALASYLWTSLWLMIGSGEWVGLLVDGTAQLLVYRTHGTDANIIYSNTYQLPLYTSSLVVFTNDGEQADLYIDGQLFQSNVASGLTGATFDSFSAGDIGWWSPLGALVSQDEALVLDRALTGGEVADLYAAAIGVGASSSVAATAGHASATGTAFGAGTQTPPGHASGTGQAYAASVSVAVNAGHASATGTAFGVAPSISDSAPGGHASATGIASQPAPSVAPWARAVGDLRVRGTAAMGTTDTATYAILVRYDGVGPPNVEAAIQGSGGQMVLLLTYHDGSEGALLGDGGGPLVGAQDQDWTIDFEVSGPASSLTWRGRAYPTNGPVGDWHSGTVPSSGVNRLDSISRFEVNDATETSFASWGSAGAWADVYRATPSTATHAGHASATGTAFVATPSVKVNAGHASATGAAFAATVSTAGASTEASAGHASATGTAGQITPSVSVTAGHAAATGAAFGAGAQTPPGHASGTGQAFAASVVVAVNAGHASASGVAYAPSISTTDEAPAGHATATGQAFEPSVSVSVTAGHAAATGAAFGATVATTADTSVSAGHASATGAAGSPIPSVATTAGHAAGAGQAQAASLRIEVHAGHASATGAAFGSTVSTEALTYASAGHASVTGQAFRPSASIATGAGHASATGQAYGLTPADAPNTGHASATGSAGSPTPSIAPTAGQASATGAAYAPSISVQVHAGHAAATGQAFDATVSTQSITYASAGHASATGQAFGAGVSIAPHAGHGEAFGTAHAPKPSVQPTSGGAAALAEVFPASAWIAVHAGHGAATGVAFDATTPFQILVPDDAVGIVTQGAGYVGVVARSAHTATLTGSTPTATVAGDPDESTVIPDTHLAEVT